MWRSPHKTRVAGPAVSTCLPAAAEQMARPASCSCEIPSTLRCKSVITGIIEKTVIAHTLKETGCWFRPKVSLSDRWFPVLAFVCVRQVWCICELIEVSNTCMWEGFLLPAAQFTSLNSVKQYFCSLASLFSSFSCFNRMLWRCVKQQVIISVWKQKAVVKEGFILCERWKSGIVQKSVMVCLEVQINQQLLVHAGVCFPESDTLWVSHFYNLIEATHSILHTCTVYIASTCSPWFCMMLIFSEAFRLKMLLWLQQMEKFQMFYSLFYVFFLVVWLL